MLKISGNMIVYLHIPNLIFVNVFGIRGNYSFNIQNIRNIHMLGFPISRLLEKSLEISRRFSIGPLFSKTIEWTCHTGGYIPYSIYDSNMIFLVTINVISKRTI